MAAVQKTNYGEPAPSIFRRVFRVRTRGQALVIVALMLTVLLLFIGLGVDVGNMMARRAKLQSAVDSAVLSAAQELAGGGSITQTATIKAKQILEASGVPSNTLNVSRTLIDFPAPSQVHMRAVQRVDTYFMRILPFWQTVEISADSTADLNAYAEINSKPYGVPGIVNELNLMVWGPDSRRQNGDAYSPIYDRDPNNGNAPIITNTQHSELPYGYLYRIDVPPNFPGTELVVQIFDPDSYNRPDAPPAWPTPSTCSPLPCTPPPTPTSRPDNYAVCNDPNRYPLPTPPTDNSRCTTNDVVDNPGMYIDSFPINGAKSRPAFWRVDEYRCAYTGTCNQYTPSNGTVATFSLWHFDPHITSAFNNPYQLSDYAPSGTPGPIATYVAPGGSTTEGPKTDLRWYQPPGFRVTLNNFAAEADGSSRYFYLYVQGTAGSSENNFDLRVGPPQNTYDGYDCTSLTTAPYTTGCYVNNMYYTKMKSASTADWNDGSSNGQNQAAAARIFAKRALPLNLDTGTSFPPLLTQVDKNAAGQILGIRHFDMDQGPTRLYYQLQKCGCSDTSDNNCFDDISGPQGGQTFGYASNNDTWTDSWPSGTNQPDPEKVYIPVEGSNDYNKFFGVGGSCPTSWLRIQNYPSYANDTSVWEMPFIRPRLIK